jgi:hypothetical protein
MGDYFDWRNINVGGRIIVYILAGLLVVPPFLFLLVYTFKVHPKLFKSLWLGLLLILTTVLIILSSLDVEYEIPIIKEKVPPKEWSIPFSYASVIFLLINIIFFFPKEWADKYIPEWCPGKPIIYRLLIVTAIVLPVLTDWGKIFVGIRSIYGDKNLAKQIFSGCYSKIWEYIFYIPILLFLAFVFICPFISKWTNLGILTFFFILGGIIAIKTIFFCEDKPSIKCSELDEEKCKNTEEFCSSDPNLSEEDCGTCSNSPDCEDDDCSQDLPTNKSDCIDKEKEWSSLMTDCYWNKPSNDSISACDIDVGTLDRLNESPVEEKCLTQITKCDDIDCNDFQLSNLFNDCCPVEDWKKNMDCDTLSSILEDDNIDTMEEALNAEYNLKKASSSEFQRRREMDAGLYE